MKKFIEEKMIDYFKNCRVDRFGQVKVIDPYVVFKEKTEDVIEYLKNDPFIVIRSYGDRYGDYLGISPSYDIISNELKNKCYSMLKENQSFIWAMSH